MLACQLPEVWELEQSLLERGFRAGIIQGLEFVFQVCISMHIFNSQLTVAYLHQLGFIYLQIVCDH